MLLSFAGEEQRAAIVHINSYPGVGKLTIGRALADLIGG